MKKSEKEMLQEKNKIEALADRILHQCEQEGFTLAEMEQLPWTLRNVIGNYVTRVKECTKVNLSTVSKTPDIVSCTSEQNPDDHHPYLI